MRVRIAFVYDSVVLYHTPTIPITARPTRPGSPPRARASGVNRSDPRVRANESQNLGRLRSVDYDTRTCTEVRGASGRVSRVAHRIVAAGFWPDAAPRARTQPPWDRSSTDHPTTRPPIHPTRVPHSRTRAGHLSRPLAPALHVPGRPLPSYAVPPAHRPPPTSHPYGRAVSVSS